MAVCAAALKGRGAGSHKSGTPDPARLRMGICAPRRRVDACARGHAQKTYPYRRYI